MNRSLFRVGFFLALAIGATLAAWAEKAPDVLGFQRSSFDAALDDDLVLRFEAIGELETWTAEELGTRFAAWVRDLFLRTTDQLDQVSEILLAKTFLSRIVVLVKCVKHITCQGSTQWI